MAVGKVDEIHIYDTSVCHAELPFSPPISRSPYTLLNNLDGFHHNLFQPLNSTLPSSPSKPFQSPSRLPQPSKCSSTSPLLSLPPWPASPTLTRELGLKAVATRNLGTNVHAVLSPFTLARPRPPLLVLPPPPVSRSLPHLLPRLVPPKPQAQPLLPAAQSPTRLVTPLSPTVTLDLLSVSSLQAVPLL